MTSLATALNAVEISAYDAAVEFTYVDDMPLVVHNKKRFKKSLNVLVSKLFTPFVSLSTRFWKDGKGTLHLAALTIAHMLQNAEGVFARVVLFDVNSLTKDGADIQPLKDFLLKPNIWKLGLGQSVFSGLSLWLGQELPPASCVDVTVPFKMAEGKTGAVSLDELLLEYYPLEDFRKFHLHSQEAFDQVKKHQVDAFWKTSQPFDALPHMIQATGAAYEAFLIYPTFLCICEGMDEGLLRKYSDLVSRQGQTAGAASSASAIAHQYEEPGAASDQATYADVIMRTQEDMFELEAQRVEIEAQNERDFGRFLEALPVDIRTFLEQEHESILPRLTDLIMDVGRPLLARIVDDEGQLMVQELGYKDDAPLTHDDIKEVYGNVGQFGNDNRAGIDGTLHRISVLRSRLIDEEEKRGIPIGLTMRVGRVVQGSIALIQDLLLQSKKNLLIVGEPGVGKTSLLRQTARFLSTKGARPQSVMIVDTSNEIAGDGDIPHAGIGKARRIQVPQREFQYQVMIECVQNHTPQVIVIDEIGQKSEAKAASTIGQRGVRIIATAHGSQLSDVIHNDQINELLGGLQTVILSAAEAKQHNKEEDDRPPSKVRQEVKTKPIFDLAVEIHDRQSVTVYMDVKEAVTAYLAGKMARCERRRMLPDGSIGIQRDDEA